jgi:hypothetical protein
VLVEVRAGDPAGFHVHPALAECETLVRSLQPDIVVDWATVEASPEMREDLIPSAPAEYGGCTISPLTDGWTVGIHYRSIMPHARMLVDRDWSNIEFLDQPGDPGFVPSSATAAWNSRCALDCSITPASSSTPAEWTTCILHSCICPLQCGRYRAILTRLVAILNVFVVWRELYGKTQGEKAVCGAHGCCS